MVLDMCEINLKMMRFSTRSLVVGDEWMITNSSDQRSGLEGNESILIAPSSP
jgi:hypothetical protein